MEPPEAHERSGLVVKEEDFWLDPDPESVGILLSDRIEFYAMRVSLISPFDRGSLGPASYTLHVGKEYILNNRHGDLSKNETVEIPPNGLIYIRFFEEVNIPHYMIARFNLRVKQVYRGLLLGTGPQVDPGFRGHLNCPIHNFTDEPKVIRYGDPLVTIDFEKTTRLGQTSFVGKNDEGLKSVLAGVRNRNEKIVGVDNLPCELFNKKADRPLKEYLPRGESVKSSIFDLHQRVERSEKIFFWSAVVGGLGIAGIVITTLGIAYSLYSGLETNVFTGYTDLKENVRQLSQAIGKLEGINESRNAGAIHGSKAESKLPTAMSKPTDKASK